MMRVPFCLVVLLIGSTRGFVPLSSQLGRSIWQRNHDRNTARYASSSSTTTKPLRQLNMVTMPNPFKKLPWNVQKEREREERRLKQEGVKLYRELGVSEDATFEEIQEATQNLLMKHEGDLKKKVKIEITKDKIMQLRLNQRLGGMLKDTKEARAASYLKDDAIEYEKGSKQWEPPKWTRGLIVKPGEQWRDTCVIFFGGSAVAGLFLPTAAGGLQFISFCLSGGFLAKRGAPESQPGMSYRERVGSHTALAFFLAFVVYVFTTAFATALTRSIPAIADNPIEKGVQNVIISGALGVATAFLHPYRKK